MSKTIMPKTVYSLLIAASVTLAAAHAFAQRTVASSGGFPIAPQGLANRPLPPGPYDYATAEEQDIRVVVVTKAMRFPYSMTFLPDGTLLVTERIGQLRVIRNGQLDPTPVSGGPESVWKVESGLPGTVHGYMNIALHPQFAQNQLLYLSYTKPLPDGKNTAAVARARWTGHSLADLKDVFVSNLPSTPTSIVFGSDGMLYIAPGDPSGDDAQNPGTYRGKILRVRDDGSAPADNPFIGKAGYKPEIYTLGHRNSLGLAVHPVTGELWQSENGQNGGDELNIIRAGRNYGWPLVSYGRKYNGPWQAGLPTHVGYEPPVVYWMPSIAVAGFAFYTGNRLPKWTGDMFVTGLRTGEIPGTGHLERILFNENMQELRRETLLLNLGQRMRDVKQGPDGLLYVVTEEDEGAVLRIEPR